MGCDGGSSAVYVLTQALAIKGVVHDCGQGMTIKIKNFNRVLKTKCGKTFYSQKHKVHFESFWRVNCPACLKAREAKDL